MAWHTNALSKTNILIQDGTRVVGSIVKVKSGEWRVEILWAPRGDITFASKDYACALAFVRGVEAVIDRMSGAPE